MTATLPDLDTATTCTQEELRAVLTDRFGPNPHDWAFVCPRCGDVATGADFKAALAEHPVTYSDGHHVTASARLGRECIGRTLGALTLPKAVNKRGCDWAAYGLIRGPLLVTTPEGSTIAGFRPAPAPVKP